VCCNYKLNTLTDVPYQMTVGGAFVHVCENMWKRLEPRSRVYNAFFPVDPDDRVIIELQCIHEHIKPWVHVYQVKYLFFVGLCINLYLFKSYVDKYMPICSIQ